MKLRSFQQGLPATLLTVALTLPLAAQNTVALNGTSGAETYNTSRTTTGGLTLGLEFQIEYLMVGGGGGGGGAAGSNAGGGGGGQVLTGTASGITNQSYSVTVGSGGMGGKVDGTLSQTVGTIGDSSLLSGTGLNLTSRGGGGGAGSLGYNGVSVQVANATSGASGGGGSSQASTTLLGLRALGTSGEGFAGGNAVGNSTDYTMQSGGGGGGAGGAGVAGSSTKGGNGGVGLSSSITGTVLTYGGGGGGGKRATGSAGAGGQGGGGDGALNGKGVDGNANTGGGGGGSGSVGGPGGAFEGGAGGSGIVIIRYKGESAGTGGTVTAGTNSAAGYTLHTFTSTGSSSLDLSGLNLNNRLGAVENGVISGNGDLTFTGPGTMTLNAANTYSGRTHINAGTLALGSSGSITNSSGVNIASGANFNVTTVTGGFTLGAEQNLSGGGTITGDVTISGSHTPGFSPGVQTFADDLTYTVGSSVVWELIDNTIAGRGTNYDGIDVGGNLSFTGSTTINLDFALAGSTVNWSDSFWDSDITGTSGWKLFDVAGSISGFEDNLQLAVGPYTDGSSQSLTSVRSDASFYLYKGEDGIYLNYSAVPEPSAAVLAALSAIGLLRRKRS